MEIQNPHTQLSQQQQQLHHQSTATSVHTPSPPLPPLSWPFEDLRVSTKPPPPSMTPTGDVLGIIRRRRIRLTEEANKREGAVLADRLSKCESKYIPLLKSLESSTAITNNTVPSSNSKGSTSSTQSSEHCCILSSSSMFQFSHDVVVNGMLVPSIVTWGGVGVPSDVLRQLLKLAESEMDKRNLHKGITTTTSTTSSTAGAPLRGVGISFRERHINQLWRLMPTTSKEVMIPFTDLLPPYPVLHPSTAAATATHQSTCPREAGRKSGRQSGGGGGDGHDGRRRGHSHNNNNTNRQATTITPTAPQSSAAPTSIRLAEQDTAVPLDVLCGMNRRALPGLMYHDLCYQLLSDLGLRHMILESGDSGRDNNSQSTIITNIFADSAASIIREEMAELHVKCAPPSVLLSHPSNSTTISIVDAVTTCTQSLVPSSSSSTTQPHLNPDDIPTTSSSSVPHKHSTPLLTVRVEGGGVCLPILTPPSRSGDAGNTTTTNEGGVETPPLPSASSNFTFHMPRLVSVTHLPTTPTSSRGDSTTTEPTCDAVDSGAVVVRFGEGSIAKKLAVHFSTFARRVICQHTATLQARYCTYNNVMCSNSSGCNIEGRRLSHHHHHHQVVGNNCDKVYQCGDRQLNHRCSSSRSTAVCSSSRHSNNNVGSSGGGDVEREVRRLVEQARRHVQEGRYKTVRPDPSRDWLNKR